MPKRFAGNPEISQESILAGDIVPMQHDISNEGGEDRRVSFATMKHYFTDGESAARQQADSALDARLTAAEDGLSSVGAVIPADASAQNQLADKNFVESLVSTSTATFRGSFGTKADLDAYDGDMDLNDYAVVAADETHSGETWRYKHDGTAWSAEYKVNDTALTPAQTAALGSGITQAKVQKLDDGMTKSEIMAKLAPTAEDSDKFLAGDGNWKTAAAALFNSVYPVGVTYVQYPQQESPNVLFAGSGSVWQVIDYGGAFFRAQGGNAETFSEKTDDLKLQSDMVKSHTHGMKNHTHRGTTGSCRNLANGQERWTGWWNGGNPSDNINPDAGGAVWLDGNLTGRAEDEGSDFSYKYRYNIDVNHRHDFSTGSPSDNTTDSNDSSATENRPMNYTIRIWKRIS